MPPPVLAADRITWPVHGRNQALTLMAGSATNYTVWESWNANYTTTTATNVPSLLALQVTVTVSTVWGAWNAAYTGMRETREQREIRERSQAASRLRAEEARRARAVVNNRAEELLLSLLSDEQARTYLERGWFEVRGSRGGRWRIRNRGQSGNVDLMPETGEERLATYCAHPPDRLPDSDAYVAQMLALVTDEDGFRRVANVHYRRPRIEAA